MLCTNPTGNISELSQNSVGVWCPKDESFDPLMDGINGIILILFIDSDF